MLLSPTWKAKERAASVSGASSLVPPRPSSPRPLSPRPPSPRSSSPRPSLTPSGGPSPRPSLAMLLRPPSAASRRPSASDGEEGAEGEAGAQSRRNSERGGAVPHRSWRSLVRNVLPGLAGKRLRSLIDKKRRKSFSNPENIENFQKEEKLRLEEQIKLHHLQQLMHEFSVHQPDDIMVQEGSGYFPPKLLKRTPGCMNQEEFKDTISKVLGTDEYNEYLEKLFTKLDTSCDGYVDWNEFCTYMLLLYRENDYIRTKREIPFLVEPKIRHVVHNRQESTCKILSVENPTRFITVSKEGAMSVWMPTLQFEKHYTVADDAEDASGQKRRFKLWVTDAIYLPNCNKLAVGSTSRDIRFYDVSTNNYFEDFRLFAMSDVPYCFDYHYDPKNPSAESLLVFGVDTGAIHLLYFHRPVTQLFEMPFKSDGGVKMIFMKDLPNHVRWVRHEMLPDVHPDIIRQVRYLPENDSIISSSGNPKSTVLISDVQRLRRTYVFRIEKGVESFDYSRALNLLVTGSLDHHVRLWNPYVTSKPVAILSGHSTGVIGTVIHEELMQVFSYSRDAVVKVWDIKEHTCVQTILLKFPSSIHGRMPEHGQFPLHLQGAPHSGLLLTCNDYLGLLKLGAVSHAVSLAPTTHDTQLCCALYNQFFKQVVTGCDSSSIAVWDIETGNKAIVFSNAHGDEEITAMVFDQTWRRLITGARNGTIKVWNFQNGHNLHKLEPAAEAEVTGILPLQDKKVILAVGWSRLITLYDDSDADNMYIPADNTWKGDQLHKDDILAVDFSPPYYVATAGFDGEIIVWDAETEKVFVRLRKGQTTNISEKIDDLKTHSPDSRQSSGKTSRPNSRHRQSHKPAKGQPVPVDKLLFLRGRVSARHSEAASLVSSEAGVLHWWSLLAVKKELGYFYAPDMADESVLAMCTKPNNSILVTGDTKGQVKVWDITSYCVKPADRRVKTRPPLEADWRAHEAAVVSVEYVEHDSGVFLLTASIDKTARLWTLDGQCVGTFGQKRSWDLKKPATWQQPVMSWPVEEKKEHPEVKADKEKKPAKERTEPESVEDTHTTKQPQYTSAIPTLETSLGLKAEQEFARKINDRQGRRNLFGDINVRQTSRFGKICSPYQALATPEVLNISLPQNLPLSQRMQQRGYSSQNLTEEKLRSMDFSYTSPDTPPTSDQLAPARAEGPSTPETAARPGEAEPKLPPIQNDRPLRVSASSSFKKFPTVI